MPDKIEVEVNIPDHIPPHDTQGGSASALSLILQEETVHGCVIGIIHRKSIDFEDTLVFYHDGFAREVCGFKIGEKDLATRALLMAIQRIPCTMAAFYSSMVASLSSIDDGVANEFFEDVKDCVIHYIFRPLNELAEGLTFNLDECVGMKVMTQFISQTSENDGMFFWDNEYE